MDIDEKLKSLVTRWPNSLIIPSEEDFMHDSWMNQAITGNLDYRSRKKVINSCGTQCCLVGWSALAFGEKGVLPDDIKNGATIKFLLKFCEFAGHQFDEKTFDQFLPMDKTENIVLKIAEHASDVFEGTVRFGLGDSQKLTPQKSS
jgi:hypothetical protein